MHNANAARMICALRPASVRKAKSPARVSVLIAAIWIRGKSKILIHQASLRTSDTRVDAITASSAIVKSTSNSRSLLDRALTQHSTRPARRKVGRRFRTIVSPFRMFERQRHAPFEDFPCVLLAGSLRCLVWLESPLKTVWIMFRVASNSSCSPLNEHGSS